MHQGISRRRFLLASAAASLALPGAGRTRGAERPGVVPVDQWLRDQVAHAPLKMQFRGTTAEECRQWQAEFSAKLRALLGPYTPPPTWTTVVESVQELDDHRREQLLLVADGLAPLPVYLLLPRGKTAGRLAGVLALHGHGDYGYHTVAGRDDLPGVEKSIRSANYDYGRQLARRGYAVAVPCLTPFGPRAAAREKTDTLHPCADPFIRMLMLGKLLIAENLRDCLWAFEMLARHDRVDARRMGCVGLSYGGRMTMLTAALEPRVRVAVVAGALNVMQERISKPFVCGAQIIPGLLEYGDVPEIGSLIAPRHSLWEIGSRDALLPREWADQALARMRRAYAAMGVEDRLLVDRFEGGHAWDGKPAYPLLEKVLG